MLTARLILALLVLTPTPALAICAGATRLAGWWGRRKLNVRKNADG